MRNPSTHRRPGSGFTLVEVMMAATILTVGFIGLIQAVAISSGMMDQARRQSLATQILQNEIENLRGANWATISTLPLGPTVVGKAWDAALSYSVGDLVTNGGNWYRCIFVNSGQSPPSLSYWKLDPPPFASVVSTEGIAYGATFTITRTSADVIAGSLREATFTIDWVVTTSRRDSGGNLVTFKFTRTNSAYFGKYGLNLAYQRS